MNTNMFDLYYNYKIKTVFQYSILLSKILGINKNKLWNSKRKTEESLKEIIKDYFEKIEYNKRNNQQLIRCFINNKEILKYNIDKELCSVINYFINKNKAFEIVAYEKEIILAAVILKIANDIDIATSPFKENKNNYKTILMTYLEKYRKIDFISVIDNGKKKTNILLELIKTNVRKERKIFENLTSNISFNKYICIKDNMFISQYNYSVPGIKKFDKNAINYIYNSSNIDDEFVLISADLITITLMKMFSVRATDVKFYIPLKKEFFETEKNLKNISYIFKNKYLNKHINVLVNHHEFDEKIYKILNKYKTDYYLYSSINTQINEKFKNDNASNYLLSKDFYQKYKNIVDNEKTDDLNIIVEDYQGIYTDKELIIKIGGLENE